MKKKRKGKWNPECGRWGERWKRRCKNQIEEWFGKQNWKEEEACSKEDENKNKQRKRWKQRWKDKRIAFQNKVKENS